MGGRGTEGKGACFPDLGQSNNIHCKNQITKHVQKKLQKHKLFDQQQMFIEAPLYALLSCYGSVLNWVMCSMDFKA